MHGLWFGFSGVLVTGRQGGRIATRSAKRGDGTPLGPWGCTATVAPSTMVPQQPQRPPTDGSEKQHHQEAHEPRGHTCMGIAMHRSGSSHMQSLVALLLHSIQASQNAFHLKHHVHSAHEIVATYHEKLRPTTTMATEPDSTYALPEDFAPIHAVTAIGNRVMRLVGAATEDPGVEAVGMAKLPLHWRRLIRQSATTDNWSALDAWHKLSSKHDARTINYDPGVSILRNVVTGDKLKDIGVAYAAGTWVEVMSDPVWRAEHGLDQLTPGAHIMYTGVSGQAAATHHGIYLGRFGPDDFRWANYITACARSLEKGVPLPGTYTDEAPYKQFIGSRGVHLKGGSRGAAGVDLVLEVNATKVMETRVHVIPLARFAYFGSVAKGCRLIMQLDADADPHSTMLWNPTDRAAKHETVPTWLVRAVSMVGRVIYSLKMRNCEHFATFVQTGRYSSRQIMLWAEGFQQPTTVKFHKWSLTLPWWWPSNLQAFYARMQARLVTDRPQ